MIATSINRRHALVAGGAALAAPLSLAQPGKAAAGRSLTVIQVVDTTTAQQDVSRDFLIGSRAFWQDANSRGGLKGRAVQHTTIEVDGTPASLKTAVAAIRDTPSCVAVSGTSGDRAATALIAELRKDGVAIAHAAPWLQDSSADIDDQTFPIFATRQDQIAHAIRSLSVMSVSELGIVYASEAERAASEADLTRAAQALKMRLQHYRAGGELTRLGQQLTASTPAILLFVGGTPELVQFTQGLEKQTRQRYVVALADVNLQTMIQMGAGRTTPVIATQPVPLVTASAPVVRAYRDVMARLFDEPPVSLSLAGFIAARYTYEVLADIDGTLTRASVLAGFQRRATVDVGGFRVAFDQRRRSGTFVTQSMLTQDGRVIG